MQMLSYGCTRLEIGLQSIYEDVARDTNRGHTVAAVGECFRLAKDAGFKVTTFHSPVTPPSSTLPGQEVLDELYTSASSSDLYCRVAAWDAWRAANFMLSSA